MTNQIINVGSAEQAGDGESIRSAFVKINENFTETNNKWGNIVIDGSTISTSDESDIQVQGHIIPSADATYDLGSPSRQWRSMYVSTNTIYINNTPISVDGYGNLTINGDVVSGLTVSDFGEGFSLTANDKLVTNKLYSTNLTQPNQHYRLELDTNGVIHLPDQSIINGATLKSVAGNYAGITAGPIGKDEDSWMWVDSGGAFIATDYSTHAYTWTFDNSGNLTLPGDIQATTGNSVRISSGSNTGGTSAHIKLYGAGGEGSSDNTSPTSGDIDIVAGVDGGDEDDHNYGNLNMGNIRLKTSAYTGQPVNEWKFGWDGKLTLAGVPTPNFFGDQGTIQYQPSGWFPLQTVGTTINGTVGGTSVAAAFKFNKTLYEFDFTTLRVGVDIIMLDYADVGYPDPPGTKGYPATITVSIQDPDNQDLWIIGQNNAGVGLAEGTTLWLKYNDENISLNETWGFSSSRLNMPGNAKFSNGNHEWTFGRDGALNLPANGVIRNPNGIKRTNIVSGGDFVQLQWTTPEGAAEEDPNATTEQLNWLFVEQNGIYLETNVNGPGATHSWRFNTAGGLGFPDETVQTTAFPGFPDIVVTGETAPDTGILWFNTQEARIYIKYDEQWVDASPTVLVPPNTNPTLESVTFNDATVQTTAWSGSVSYNNITDAPTFVGGGNASTWLTAG